jgi:hypothetical protein
MVLVVVVVVLVERMEPMGGGGATWQSPPQSVAAWQAAGQGRAGQQGQGHPTAYSLQGQGMLLNHRHPHATPTRHYNT